MRSNGLLKWLMIPVALVVLFFGIRLFSNGGSKVPIGTDASAQLTPDEMKALGIQGDTPRDTVATLVAQVKQLRTELQTATTDNKSQREENQRLRQRESAIDQRIGTAGQRVGGQVLELAQLVAAQGQRGEVVALDVDVAPGPGRQAFEPVQRGGCIEQGQAFEAFELVFDHGIGLTGETSTIGSRGRLFHWAGLCRIYSQSA